MAVKEARKTHKIMNINDLIDHTSVKNRNINHDKTGSIFSIYLFRVHVKKMASVKKNAIPKNNYRLRPKNKRSFW